MYNILIIGFDIMRHFSPTAVNVREVSIGRNELGNSATSLQ